SCVAFGPCCTSSPKRRIEVEVRGQTRRRETRLLVSSPVGELSSRWTYPQSSSSVC
ncbi:uncharacterized, partial [Tachysurus ichikawai]